MGDKKKSDLDKFIELYKSVGIDISPDDDEYYPSSPFGYEDDEKTVMGKTMHICMRKCEPSGKVMGLQDVHTTLVFDGDGKFVRQELGGG